MRVGVGLLSAIAATPALAQASPEALGAGIGVVAGLTDERFNELRLA